MTLNVVIDGKFLTAFISRKKMGLPASQRDVEEHLCAVADVLPELTMKQFVAICNSKGRLVGSTRDGIRYMEGGA